MLARKPSRMLYALSDFTFEASSICCFRDFAQLTCAMPATNALSLHALHLMAPPFATSVRRPVRSARSND